MMVIERIYHPYTKWEDWRAGMYDSAETPEDELLIDAAKKLLSDKNELKSGMKKAAFKWIYAAEQNLTNTGRNRRAWLGQAACMITCGSPERLTKTAWWVLSDQQRNIANGVADEVISLWEIHYIERSNPCLKLNLD